MLIVQIMKLILAEFGYQRVNAGDSNFLQKLSRLDPTYSSYRQVYPEAEIVLYTDMDIQIDGVEVVKVNPPFDKNNPRYGWHCCDFYKVFGMLESKEVCVSMDSDMYICDPSSFKTLKKITEKFGCCLPANSRDLVKIDGHIGSDSDYNISEDESGGNGYITNMTPMTFDPKNERAREFYTTYLENFKKNPSRGTIHLWRAMWKTSINPYLLPLQWCVCGYDVESVVRKVGVEHPICLHVGHKEVKDKYFE
jgi:hypothetical protein